MADDGFRIATAYVAIEPTDDGFRAQLDAKVKEATEGVAAKVKLDTDAEGLAEKVRTAAAAVDAEAHVKVKVDNSGADLRTGLEQLGDQAAVDADQVGSRIGESLADGLARDAAGKLRGASDDIASDAEKMASGLDDAGNSADNAGNKLSGAGKKASDAGKDASDSSSGWKNFADGAKTAGSAMLVVSGISLAPALGAIPGLAAGAAAGLATLAGAFLGVAKAFKDYGAASGGGGGGVSGAQQAATAYSNAVAIRNANQQISDAETQAARSAVTSAEQVQSAKQGVIDAERNAATAAQSSADQITAAQQRVNQAAYAGVQAGQSYTNALYNQAQAQQAVVNAQQAAANQLIDSQNSAKDAHLSTEEAELAERNAQTALDAANGNSLLTADQKLAAQLALQQATQQVADAKQHELEATQAAQTAAAAGVDNAPTVLAAQHALTLATQATASAQYGVQQAAQSAADAQTGLARAQQAAANQQITSDESVAKSQQQLADAERTAAQQRADAAQTVARAQQNLADTIKQQQLAAAAAGASGSAAVNQFAKDMQNLSPAGRAFVNQLISMKGEFHDLSLAAQTATLPGFTQMLKDSNGLLPTVEVGIRNTGKALSDTAAAAGALFANPQFDASAMQFTQIVTSGFGQFVSALPPLLNAIVTDGVKAAPLINSVALGVHDLVGSGLPNFLSGLTVNAGGAAQGVTALFGAVDGLLGPIGTLAGAASGALGPALATLEPGFLKLVDDIEAGLLPLMPELSTDLVDIAQIMEQLFQVAEPLIPVISDDLASGLRIIDPLLKDTADFLQENQSWLPKVAEGILAVVVAVKAWNMATGAIKSVVTTAGNAISSFSDTVAGAKGNIDKAATALGGTEGLASKLGIVGAVTGGVAVGIVGIGEALNHVLYQSHGAATSVDQFTEALLNSESVNDDATKKLDQYAQMAQQMGAANSGVTDSMAQTGLGLIQLGKGLFGTTEDMKNYDASLAAMVSDGNADRAATVVQQLANATDSHGLHLVDVNTALPQYEAALEQAGVQAQTTARATDQTSTAMQQLGADTQITTDKFAYMNDSLSRAQALQQFKTQLLDLKSAEDQNGVSLDGNTAKGLANQAQFANLAQQIEAYGQQLSKSGDTDGLVAIKMQDMIGQLEAAAGQYGYSKQQVDAYVKSIGLIPSTVETNINTAINLSVNQQLLEAAAQDIGHVVGGHILVPGQAAGGLVTGPGTGTSDSVLRRLSNGEFVVQAGVVQQPGMLAALTALNNGTGGVPVTQVGGTTPQAGAPVINLNYFGTMQPTPEQQQNMMLDLEHAVRSS